MVHERLFCSLVSTNLQHNCSVLHRSNSDDFPVRIRNIPVVEEEQTKKVHKRKCYTTRQHNILLHHTENNDNVLVGNIRCGSCGNHHNSYSENLVLAMLSLLELSDLVRNGNSRPSRFQ